MYVALSKTAHLRYRYTECNVEEGREGRKRKKRKKRKKERKKERKKKQTSDKYTRPYYAHS